MKTEASRKREPLDAGLADVLTGWGGICPYNQDGDYIFASPEMDGKQPYWPTSAMADHIRPAALRAGITKRVGWHTLRHTFGTLVKSLGDYAGAHATRECQHYNGQVRPSCDASQA